MGTLNTMAAQPVRTMSVTKESGSSEETLGLTDADSRVELVASAPSKAAEAPEIQPWAAISGSQLFWTLFSGLMFGFALQVSSLRWQPAPSADRDTPTGTCLL